MPAPARWAKDRIDQPVVSPLFFASLLRHAHARPDHPALVISGRATSYRQLAQLVCAARDWIGENLPDNEGTIAVCARQPLVDWVLLLALRSLGRNVVAAPDLAMPRRIGLADVSTALTLSREGEPALANPDGMRVCAIPFAALTAAARLEPPAQADDARFGDAIEYTSGTTGTSKAILRPGHTQAALCDRTRREYDIGPETVFHFGNLLPWTSVGSKGPLTVWREGGACVLDFRKDWAAHAFEFPVNRLFAPPHDIRALADASEARARKTSSGSSRSTIRA